MKTSYFANIQNIKKPVSICQGPPWWYNGPEFKALAPPWELVRDANRGLPEHIYAARYSSMVLLKLNPRHVYDQLIREHGEDCLLLCHENLARPGDWCHRRMVAHWFEDNLGVEVPEWQPPSKMRSTLSW